MGEQTAISWTDATWNPARGCVKVSPGCAHCYAETFAERFRGVPGHPYEQGFDLRLVPDKLEEPLRWEKPRRIFVNSMSDLFQDGVPDEYIDRVFAVMALCPQHTFQVLTKRAERMRDYITADYVANRVFAAMQALTLKAGVWSWPTWAEAMRNVWLGVSVESQKYADERIPLLLQTPAPVRFISAEPLLGPIDLDNIEYAPIEHARIPALSADRRIGCLIVNQQDRGNSPTFPRLDWVIAGGESGAKARPPDPAWIRSLRDQCVRAGVPFHFKQWGGRTPKTNGRELDGREWLEFPARRNQG